MWLYSARAVALKVAVTWDHNWVPKKSCDLTGDRYNVRLTDTFVNCGQVRFRSPSSLFVFDTIALASLFHDNVLVPR